MPERSSPGSSVLRFGPFEVDVRSAELRKAGVRIALQDQPFRLLLRLVQRPGILVTREELRQELWPGDTFVDFERGLNTAVKRLRDALGDEADTPRFIETRPRRGYRFIAPVTDGQRAHVAGTSGDSAPLSATARTAAARPRFVAPLVAVAMIAAVAAALRIWKAPAEAALPIARYELSLSPADRLGRIGSLTPGGTRTNLAITRDGRTVVFSGTAGTLRRLFVRPLDRATAEPLAGTDDAVEPALSPDGEWVAFWSRGFLRKVRLAGGPAVPVCELGEVPMGIVWSPHDEIVFGLALSTLKKVPAAGGQPTAVTALAPGELSHRLPQIVQGGAAVVFTVRKRDYTWGDEAIAVQALGHQPHRTLIEGADARYVDTGHLVFLQLGRLMAVRFDPVRLEITGAPVGLLDDVAQSAAERNTYSASGAGQFAIAANGTLVYARGGVPPRADSRLFWVDRQGRTTATTVTPGRYAGAPRLSPDGERIVLWIWDTTRASPVVHDLTRGTTTALSGTSEDAWPIWSPEGRSVLYQSFERGEWAIKRRSADGTGVPETLVHGYSVTPGSWSSDGETLAFMQAASKGAYAVIQILGWHPGRPPEPLVATPFRVTHPAFAPSGRVLAYVGRESGRDEVYVTREGNGEPRLQVSIDGGSDPVWSRDGAELFYVAPGRGDSTLARLMSVQVSTTPILKIGAPRMLFESEAAGRMSASPVSGFDVAPDGSRFLVTLEDSHPPTPPVMRLEVVVNWLEELKTKVR